MTKQEIKKMFEKENVTPKRITKYGSDFKVKVSWKDYPKIRHLASNKIQVTM